MPAPLDNRNAIRHGLRTGKLPPKCGYITRTTNQLRHSLENHIFETRGQISLPDSAAIQTAVRWERHAMLCQRWLRLECDGMDASTRLAYSRDVAKASAERDRCIRSLGLEPNIEADPWNVVEATAVSQRESSEPRQSSESDGDNPNNSSTDKTPAALTQVDSVSAPTTESTHQ